MRSGCQTFGLLDLRRSECCAKEIPLQWEALNLVVLATVSLTCQQRSETLQCLSWTAVKQLTMLTLRTAVVTSLVLLSKGPAWGPEFGPPWWQGGNTARVCRVEALCPGPRYSRWSAFLESWIKQKWNCKLWANIYSMFFSGPHAQVTSNLFYLLSFMYEVMSFSSFVTHKLLAPKPPSQSWVLASIWDPQVVKQCHFSLWSALIHQFCGEELLGWGLFPFHGSRSLPMTCLIKWNWGEDAHCSFDSYYWEPEEWLSFMISDVHYVI